jgi:NAD(P)-dependent dehydrogenase (short-subunit alcohol dehydrogenase family)
MSSRTILVTGASRYVWATSMRGYSSNGFDIHPSVRGIGLAIAQSLLKTFHAKVITICRSYPEELKSLLAEHPEDLTVIQGDV